MGYFELGFQPFWNSDRPVALMARASDSKSEGWGFESLLACVNYLNGCERLLMVTKAIQFLSEVRSEVKKVTWPTKKEAMGGTAVVLVVVFIMALFLGLVDLLLSKIIGVIFSA